MTSAANAACGANTVHGRVAGKGPSPPPPRAPNTAPGRALAAVVAPPRSMVMAVGSTGPPGKPAQPSYTASMRATREGYTAKSASSSSAPTASRVMPHTICRRRYEVEKIRVVERGRRTTHSASPPESPQGPHPQQQLLPQAIGTSAPPPVLSLRAARLSAIPRRHAADL